MVYLFNHQENPDLWKWLTGQEQPPEAVNKNPVSIKSMFRVKMISFDFD